MPQIIKNNDHHTEGVNIIAITGLNDLETIIQLQQWTETSIRNLLLAIPAPRTTTKKLFLQVEQQANNSWLLCCYYSTDSTEVTVRTLTFNGQVIPLKKGKTKYINQKVPGETASHAHRAMTKIITATQKGRLFTSRMTKELTHQILPRLYRLQQ